MKQKSILYIIGGGAFLVASAFALFEHFTGPHTSSTWLIMGSVFFIAALPMLLMFTRSIRKAK